MEVGVGVGAGGRGGALVLRQSDRTAGCLLGAVVYCRTVSEQALLMFPGTSAFENIRVNILGGTGAAFQRYCLHRYRCKCVVYGTVQLRR